jgi:hypothetical protein
MSNSFSQMKKNSSSLSEKIEKKLENQNSNQSYGDDRYWKPTRDKAGNAYSVIRFLPAPEGEEDAFQTYWDHGFQGPTGLWYIENSLTTIGKDDPVSEFNSKLWAEGKDDNSPQRAQARKQKRRLHYVSNILVIEDPDHPENEGKVFLFKYGKQIMDKIEAALKPQLSEAEKKSKKARDSIKAFNPFDLWEGADFVLKMKMADNFPTYIDSHFDSVSAVSGTEEELEAMWKQEYSLNEVVDPKSFKPYTELKAKLNRVLGIDGGEVVEAPSISETVDSVDDSSEDETPAWSESDTSESGLDNSATESELDTDDFFDTLDKD